MLRVEPADKTVPSEAVREIPFGTELTVIETVPPAFVGAEIEKVPDESSAKVKF